MTTMQARLVERPRLAPALILLASVAMLGGALAFQYLGGLAPCALCIYQRIPYAVTIALSVIALPLAGTLGRRGLAIAVGLCSLAFAGGAAVALFHVGVEQHWWQGLSGCGGNIDPSLSFEEFKAQLLATPVVRCDEVPWSLFGISMAGYNFLASVTFAVAALVAARRFLGVRHVATA